MWYVKDCFWRKNCMIFWGFGTVSAAATNLTT